MAETVKKVNGVTPVNGNVTIEVPKVDTSTLATKTELTSLGTATPKGPYATLTALQTAFPTGSTGFHLVTADGFTYYWNGTAWTKGVQYQTTGIAKGGITGEEIALSVVTPEKTNFATIKPLTQNLFNQVKTTDGGYINYSTGNWVENVSFGESDFIPVKPNEAYKKNLWRILHYTMGIKIGLVVLRPTP